MTWTSLMALTWGGTAQSAEPPPIEQRMADLFRRARYAEVVRLGNEENLHDATWVVASIRADDRDWLTTDDVEQILAGSPLWQRQRSLAVPFNESGTWAELWTMDLLSQLNFADLRVDHQVRFQGFYEDRTFHDVLSVLDVDRTTPMYSFFPCYEYATEKEKYSNEGRDVASAAVSSEPSREIGAPYTQRAPALSPRVSVATLVEWVRQCRAAGYDSAAVQEVFEVVHQDLKVHAYALAENELMVRFRSLKPYLNADERSLLYSYLGMLYLEAEDVRSAEANFRSALVVNPITPDAEAIALMGLSDVSLAKRDLSGASRLLERALDLEGARPSPAGPFPGEHAIVGAILLRWGDVHVLQGDPARARDLYLSAARGTFVANGEAMSVAVVRRLALLAEGAGERLEALALLESVSRPSSGRQRHPRSAARADRINEPNSETFAALELELDRARLSQMNGLREDPVSDPTRFAAGAASLATSAELSSQEGLVVLGRLNGYLDLALSGPPDPHLERLSLLWQAISGWKGLTGGTRSEALPVQAVWRRRYLDVSSSLSAAVWSGSRSAWWWRRQVDSLRELDHAERLLEVSSRGAGDRWLGEPDQSASDLLAVLPDRTAVIEYVVYSPSGPSLLERPPPGPVYAVVVLRNAADGPHLFRVDLGPAATIDRKIRELGHQLATAQVSAPVDRVARDLAKMIWDPVAQSLEGDTQIVIAPDGALWGLSFAGLIGQDGRYLVEDYSIQYVESTRELVTAARRSAWGDQALLAQNDLSPGAGPWLNDLEGLTNEVEDVMVVKGSGSRRTTKTAGMDIVKARSGLLLVGDVDYGHSALRDRRAARPAGGAQPWGCTQLDFSPLAATGREISSIAQNAEDVGHGEEVSVLSGRRATVARVLAALKGARVAHFASHSYDADPGCVSRLDPEDSRSQPLLWAMKRQPLLLSGLALAGVNRRAGFHHPRTTGRLTALDLSVLDLRGMDLVVLSACSTALGDVVARQGVLGLRRGFHLAGVEAIMMSTSDIEDTRAADFMSRFYARYLAMIPSDPAAALLQTQREILRRNRASSGQSAGRPQDWAPFIVSTNRLPTGLAAPD